MPWLAEVGGEPVTPEDASRREDLTCPACGDEMYVRESYRREDGVFVARHFSHYPSRTDQPEGTNAGDCGGETDEHKRMKSIAYSKITEVFGDRIETIEKEMSIPASGRVADIGVIFDGDIDDHAASAATPGISGAVGDRLAVEIQYKNKSKDIEATERSYAAQGYSVLWLYPGQFDRHDVDLFTGTDVSWTPVYPEITRSDIDFPDQWVYHEEYIEPERSVAQVGASFPAHWFEEDIKEHLALNGPSPQYEWWAQLFPDVAQRYVERVEQLFENPEEEVGPVFGALFPTLDPTVMENYHGQDEIPLTEAVCGNCHYSQSDEYSDDERDIICWKNKPDPDGNRPRKLTLNDDFAHECSHFSFDPYKDETVAAEMDFPHSIYRGYIFKRILDAKGVTDRDRRKAVLKFAYGQTWGAEDWNPLKFSAGREEGFLRQLDSDYAVPYGDGCATRSDAVIPETEPSEDTESVSIAELESRADQSPQQNEGEPNADPQNEDDQNSTGETDPLPPSESEPTTLDEFCDPGEPKNN